MVRLRDYSRNDIDRLVMLANNENVSRYLVYTFPYPYTRRDAEWWINEGCKANNAVTKVIEYQGEFIGSIGVHPQSAWKAHTAEIGYWLGEPYWGKGLASNALKKMSDYAFAVLNYKKLFAPVLNPNKSSMAVLEKCAYQLEGIHKQEVRKGNQYFDIYYYAKLHDISGRNP